MMAKGSSLYQKNKDWMIDIGFYVDNNKLEADLKKALGTTQKARNRFNKMVFKLQSAYTANQHFGLNTPTAPSNLSTKSFEKYYKQLNRSLDDFAQKNAMTFKVISKGAKQGAIVYERALGDVAKANGSIAGLTVSSQQAKSNYANSIQSKYSNQKTVHRTLAEYTNSNTMRIDGLGGNTIQKSLIKENIVDFLKTSGKETNDFLNKNYKNLDKYITKTELLTNRSGEVTRAKVQMQLNEHQKLSMGLQFKNMLDENGNTFRGAVRTSNKITDNEQVKLQAQRMKLIQDEIKYTKELDKLQIKNGKNSRTQRTQDLQQELKNIKLETSGLATRINNNNIIAQQDDQRRKMLSSARGITVDDHNNKQIKTAIGLRESLYKEELRGIKLKRAGASKSETDYQTGKINGLTSALQQQLAVKLKTKVVDTQGNASIVNSKKTIGETAEAIKHATEASNKFKSAQASMNSGIEGNRLSLSRLGANMKQVARNVVEYGMAWQVFNMANQAINKTIQTLKELDAVMTELQLVTEQNDEKTVGMMNGYNVLAKELSATTMEVARGSVEWERQGKTAEETAILLRSSTMLSKIGAMDATTATELLTATLNGFNISAEDSLNIVDKLSAVDLEYATSAAEIATALRYTAASANIANVSLDKLIGLITTVSSVTRLSAETVGQSFKSIFARLQNVKAGKFIDINSGEALKFGALMDIIHKPLMKIFSN